MLLDQPILLIYHHELARLTDSMLVDHEQYIMIDLAKHSTGFIYKLSVFFLATNK